jgi:peroxiredoxin
MYFCCMRKITLLVSAAVLALVSCNSIEKNTFVLNGTTDLEDGKKIFRVQANASGQPITIDTATVDKGKFSLKGAVSQIDVNFLFVEGTQVNVPFILEEGEIKATLYKDSLSAIKLGGTSSNDDLNVYRRETQNLAAAMNAVVQEAQEANRLGDNLLAQDLQQQYADLQEQLSTYETDFVTNNTDSYISALILERFLNQKTMPKNEVKELFANYSERIRSSKSGLNISNVINAPVNPTAIGEIAPLFEGPTPTGERIALESLRGKVTIIDFWASWCRPCRIENPNLVRLYNRMHDKGLEIIGVSLDRNKASWERAIADDGLTWNHVSNLQYWSDPIAQLYSVRAIPAAFVLDREGRIVAKNLRGAQLDAKIEELLAD